MYIFRLHKLTYNKSCVEDSQPAAKMEMAVKYELIYFNK